MPARMRRSALDSRRCTGFFWVFLVVLVGQGPGLWATEPVAQAQNSERIPRGSQLGTAGTEEWAEKEVLFHRRLERAEGGDSGIDHLQKTNRQYLKLKEDRGSQSSAGMQADIRTFRPVVTFGVYWPKGDMIPTFGSFLNEMAGALDPSVRFEVEVLDDPLTYRFDLAQGVRDGRYDFIFAPSDVSVCIQAGQGTAPIASVELDIETADPLASDDEVIAETGGLILARADDNEISKLTDLHGKVVGGSLANPMGAFLLQAAEGRRGNADFLLDSRQSRLYFTDEEAIDDLLNGQIDAALAEAGTVDDILRSGNVKVINPKSTASRDGRKKLIMSTMPVPYWTLSAKNHADVSTVGFVVDTLFRINGTHPAALAGAYRSFSPPVSHGEMRNVLREMNVLSFNPADHLWVCPELLADLDDLIQCPTGMTLIPFSGTNHFNCEQADCPLNMVCTCQPCVEGTEQLVFPQDSMDKQTTPCKRMEICGVTEQIREQQYQYVDGIFGRSNAVLRWKMTGRMLVDAGTSEVGDGSEETGIQGFGYPVAGDRYGFNLSASVAGVHLVEIFVDDLPVPESPFFLNVQARDCAGHGSFREPDLKTGDCICGSGTVHLGSRCVRQSEFLAVVLICVILPAGVVSCFFTRYHSRKQDSHWIIDEDDVVFAQPVQILGHGAYGEVVKGTYKQIEVAIKKISDISYLADSSLHPVTGPDVSVHGTSAASFRANGFIHNSGQMGDRQQRLSRSMSYDGLLTPIRDGGIRSSDAFFSEAQLRRLSSLANDDDMSHSSGTTTPLVPGTPGLGFMRADGSTASRSRSRSRGSSMIRVNVDQHLVPADRRHPAPLEISMERRTVQLEPSQHRRSVNIPTLELSMKEVNSPAAQTAASTSPREPTPYRESTPNIPRLNPPRTRSMSQEVVVDGPQETVRRSDEMDDSFSLARIGLNLSDSFPDPHNTSFGSDEPVEDVKPWACWVAVQNWVSTHFHKFWEAKAKHHDREDFMTDMRVLSKLRHPCITGVVGAVLDESQTMILLEFMQYGALSDILQNEVVVIDCEMTKSILLDITAGLSFLHNYRPEIVHGDLKTGNVLVDNRFRAKISDFGLFLGGKNKIGKPTSMAPEILLGGKSSTQADIYAFGMLMWEIFTRKQPYEWENTFSALKAVADPRIGKRPEIPTSLSTTLRNMLIDCWEHSPKKRPCVVDLRRIIDGTSSMGFPDHSQHHLMPPSRSQGLLQDLLPKHVVEALMKGEKAKQDRSECATVIFAKVVGLTALSAEMSDLEIAEMLDRVFSQFDDIAQTHGVYRLETIGESYLGVSNLIEDQSRDHVARIARFALDVMDLAKRTPCNLQKPSLGNITLKVGFECGPVVGGVVGVRQQKYTIFGNTVNTASRMESCTLEGTVQCTKNARDLLIQQDASFTATLHSRGKVFIKGRGDMQTFFLCP